MMQGDELGIALSRIIEAFTKVKASIRSLFEVVKADSERREDEYKDLVARLDRINEKLVVVSGQITETRTDVKDRTPIYGTPIYRPEEANGHSKKSGGTGRELAIKDGEIRGLKASWGLTVFRVALSAGLGGILLRCVQWLIQK